MDLLKINPANYTDTELTEIAFRELELLKLRMTNVETRLGMAHPGELPVELLEDLAREGG